MPKSKGFTGRVFNQAVSSEHAAEPHNSGSPTLSDPLTTDVAVVGGGPTGSATAIALVDQGLDVCLIERTDFADPRVGEHLSPSAMSDLTALNLQDVVTAGEHRKCAQVTFAWGSDEPDHTDYLVSPFGCGWNLRRPQFDKSLFEIALERGVKTYSDARVTELQRINETWRISFDPGRDDVLHAEAPILVDATGRSAAMARMLGEETVVFDKLIGLAGFLRHPDGKSAETDAILVEATNDGWWYAAPLLEDRCVATFMTDSDILSDSCDSPEEFWLRHRQESSLIEPLLGDFELESKIIVRPAQTQRLSKLAGPGWIAVGDAAMSFDPLSSSGLSKGLGAARAVANAIGKVLDGVRGSSIRYEIDNLFEFENYLIERAAIYRRETRWPNSVFWSRRQSSDPYEAPLKIDPNEKIVAVRSGNSRQHSSHPDDRLPSVDRVLMLDLAHRTCAAHELVALFKANSRRSHTDREIIVAIQELIKDGQLKTVSA